MYYDQVSTSVAKEGRGRPTLRSTERRRIRGSESGPPNGVWVMKEPYRSEFNEYVKGCQAARKLFLDAFPWFIDIAKSTCALKKKGNVEGTAFSYLLQTIEDVVLEDVRLYFLSLQDK